MNNNNDLFNFLSFLAQLPLLRPLLRMYITMWLKGALRQEGFDYKRVKRLQNHIWYIEAQPSAVMIQQALSLLDFSQYDGNLSLYEQRIVDYNESLATAIHRALLRSGMYFIIEVRPFFRWKKSQASLDSIFRFSIGIGAPIEYTPQAKANPSLEQQFQAQSYESYEEYEEDFEPVGEEEFEQDTVYA